MLGAWNEFRGGRLWASGFVLSGLLLAAPARAQSAAASVDQGEYRVAKECPARSAWDTALAARLPKSSADKRTRALTVEVRREFRGAYVGTVLAPVIAGSARSRDVRGGSCTEVLEALALIVALELEQAVAPDPPTPEPQAPSGWELSREQALALSEVPRATPAAPHPVSRVRLGLAAFVLSEAAASSGSSFNYGLGAVVRWQRSDWQPWLLAGVYRGGSESAHLRGETATAHFERSAAQAVACPLRFPASAPIGLRPCLDLDLGRITGSGLGVDRPRQHTAFWASSGAELRLDGSPWPALELSAMFGAVVPLSRPRFYFRPGATALEPPILGLRAGALANLSF
jgi:hypothetical protein